MNYVKHWRSLHTNIEDKLILIINYIKEKNNPFFENKFGESSERHYLIMIEDDDDENIGYI